MKNGTVLHNYNKTFSWVIIMSAKFSYYEYYSTNKFHNKSHVKCIEILYISSMDNRLLETLGIYKDVFILY